MSDTATHLETIGQLQAAFNGAMKWVHELQAENATLKAELRTLRARAAWAGA